jgi:6-phosphogluconolactonase
MKRSTIIISVVLSVLVLSTSCDKQTSRLFCGSYNENGSNGFSIIDVSLQKGSFTKVSDSDAGPNPSYFVVYKKHGLVYAANEVMSFKGINGGGLTTLKYSEKTGSAEKLNEIPVPNGGPCFISLTPEEDFLLMANYTGGSVAVVKLDGSGIPESVTDNIVYENEGEKVSHAHMIATDPSGKRVYVTDLGLDRIMIYNLDKTTGKLLLVENGIVKLKDGAGPRHFVFDKSGSMMYVICELNSTISVLKTDQNGTLSVIQTLSTLDEGFKGESFCADIHIGINGKFLYGSNRGENTIVVFGIDSDGKLTLAGRKGCGGNWPRNFVIDPTGNYLLVGNQKSDNISVFRINQSSGVPEGPVGNYNVQSPVCLKFVDF